MSIKPSFSSKILYLYQSFKNLSKSIHSFSVSLRKFLKQSSTEDKSNGFEIFYTLAKDIRDIRDDLARIKKVIKLPSEDRDDPYF